MLPDPVQSAATLAVPLLLYGMAHGLSSYWLAP